MPYRWSEPAPGTQELTLRPHRSLTAPGFVWFVGLTAGFLSLPLVGVLGTPILWGLLPFMAAAVAGVWWAIRRNTADGRLTEVLTLTRDSVRLVRTEPGGAEREWTANPYWTSVLIHANGGPVENYLTLRGGGREVEIGAFLAPEERLALRHEIDLALARSR